MSQTGNGVGVRGHAGLHSGEGSGAIGSLMRIDEKKVPSVIAANKLSRRHGRKLAASVASVHSRELLSQVIRRLVAVFSTLLQLFAQAPFFNLAVERGDLLFRRT